MFLPGTSGKGSFWDPIREALGRAALDPAALGRAALELTELDLAAREWPMLDWPGLGGNPPDAAVGSFDDLVGWTIDQIAGPSVLVGQSMGGYVAMRVAIERPDLVTHLVLAVTSAGVDRRALGLDDWIPTAQDDDQAWVAEPQPNLDSMIPGVSMSTLLLWATDDPISPLNLGQRLEELMPNATLVEYPSDSHWVVLDHVEDVAQQIAALLGR